MITGSVDRCVGSRLLRSARTVANINAVADLVQSQDDQTHSHLSVREISREIDLPRSCVHDIVKKDLNLKCLKRKAAQELTEANKLARYERSKQLLRKYHEHDIDFIWFSYEKLVRISTPRNSQNDRLYVHSAVKKRDVAGRHLLSTRPMFSRSVMVSVAMSTLGCTDIHFLEPGLKVNYRNTILCNMLLLDIRRISGDWYIFQQDSVPAHRAVDFLEIETLEFISLLLWPTNSPDLNPVDYSVWSILQEMVYKTRIIDLDDLKHRIRTE